VRTGASGNSSTFRPKKSKTHEVDPDRRNVRLRIGIVREPKQKTGLSHAGISDQEEFEEIVAARRITKEGKERRVSARAKATKTPELKNTNGERLNQEPTSTI